MLFVECIDDGLHCFLMLVRVDTDEKASDTAKWIIVIVVTHAKDTKS